MGAHVRKAPLDERAQRRLTLHRVNRGRCKVAAGQVLALRLAQLLRGLRKIKYVVHNLHMGDGMRAQGTRKLMLLRHGHSGLQW